jgi:hypothetical protein
MNLLKNLPDGERSISNSWQMSNMELNLKVFQIGFGVDAS